MSVNEQTSAVFNAFIEADKALKELPAVKAELEETQAKLHSTADSLDHANSKATMLSGTIEALQAELHAKEAALAAATFRENQLSKVVDSIRGALPVVATGNSDVSVADKDKAGQSEAGPTSQVASETSTMENASVNTAKQTSADVSGSSTLNTEATHNTPVNPTIEPTQSTGNSGGQVQVHVDIQPMNSGPSGEAMSQREGNPTSTSASAESEQNGTASMAPAASTNPGDGHGPEPSNLTYLGHYPYEKPSYLSWNEWADLGGQTPNWFVRNRQA